MPRSSAITPSKILGSFFVMFVLGVIVFIYWNFISYYKDRRGSLGTDIFLVCFHISCFMLLWSLVKAMVTDPGEVPPLWGFYMGDSEAKRRRYCLMCHVFKPERCHHCSACNRCVLNMDHHCPWINNCVGFYNRKFFILLLIYVLLTTYMIAISLATHVYEVVLEIFNTRNVQDYRALMLVGAYSLTVMLSITLTVFLRFHLKLISINSTTIDNMDKENKHKANYSMGFTYNWLQVFGRNPWLWPLPVNFKSGMPLGDGVVWAQQKTRQEQMLEDSEARNRNAPSEEERKQAYHQLD